jgi:predicted nucleotidyltransferase
LPQFTLYDFLTAFLTPFFSEGWAPLHSFRFLTFDCGYVELCYYRAGELGESNGEGSLKMKRKELLKQVKQAIHEMEPDADIILYGSRSRGESVQDSDWDFLILVDGDVSDERTDRIRHRLYEIEWECDAVLSSIVRSRNEWNSPRYCATPFHQRVEQEGKRL